MSIRMSTPTPQEFCVVSAIMEDCAPLSFKTFPSYVEHANNTTIAVTTNTFSSGTFFVCSSTRVDSINQFVFTTATDDAIFQQLLQQWHLERGATSSISQMALCRSYQRIIAMGREKAVPLILRQLEKEGDNPDHWFWALQVLTNQDPVAPEDRGDMREMARAWLVWGYLGLNAR